LAISCFDGSSFDYDGSSGCGDAMVRTALYQAANVLRHHGRWSSLRSWAMRIAKRGSVKAAKVKRFASVHRRRRPDYAENPPQKGRSD
jgi:hypothetical protein